MVSNDGESWELRYYIMDRQCSMDKSSKEGLSRKYIVLPSKFNFEADDLSINIKTLFRYDIFCINNTGYLLNNDSSYT